METCLLYMLQLDKSVYCSGIAKMLEERSNAYTLLLLLMLQISSYASVCSFLQVLQLVEYFETQLFMMDFI
jgi:hypothetical protein